MISTEYLYFYTGSLCDSCVYKSSCQEFCYEDCERYEPERFDLTDTWGEMSYKRCCPKSLIQRMRDEFVQEDLDD